MSASLAPVRSSCMEARTRIRRFSDDTSGGVAIMFAMMLVALCLFVGAAVDIGRWIQARHQTIAAMDAAVLAGGRILQLNDKDVTGAQEAASRFYDENTKTRTHVIDDTIAFDAVDNKTAFAATGNAYIETAFLRLAQIPKLPLLNTSEAQFLKAILRAGGKSNDAVEIGGTDGRQRSAAPFGSCSLGPRDDDLRAGEPLDGAGVVEMEMREHHVADGGRIEACRLHLLGKSLSSSHREGADERDEEAQIAVGVVADGWAVARVEHHHAPARVAEQVGRHVDLLTLDPAAPVEEKASRQRHRARREHVQLEAGNARVRTRPTGQLGVDARHAARALTTRQRCSSRRERYDGEQRDDAGEAR